jgi:predicted RNase H-like HicB family nuclease
MKLYKLPIVLYEPSEETNDMFLAEVPVLPGCRAWGETPSEALEYVKGVAEAFIESYQDREVPLPEEVKSLAIAIKDGSVPGEIMVAV